MIDLEMSDVPEEEIIAFVKYSEKTLEKSRKYSFSLFFFCCIFWIIDILGFLILHFSSWSAILMTIGNLFFTFICIFCIIKNRLRDKLLLTSVFLLYFSFLCFLCSLSTLINTYSMSITLSVLPFMLCGVGVALFYFNASTKRKIRRGFYSKERKSQVLITVVLISSMIVTRFFVKPLLKEMENSEIVLIGSCYFLSLCLLSGIENLRQYHYCKLLKLDEEPQS